MTATPALRAAALKHLNERLESTRATRRLLAGNLSRLLQEEIAARRAADDARAGYLRAPPSPELLAAWDRAREAAKLATERKREATRDIDSLLKASNGLEKEIAAWEQGEVQP